MNVDEKILTTKRKSFPLRFEVGMDTVVEEMALEERHSVNDFICMALRFYLEVKYPAITLPIYRGKWLKQRQKRKAVQVILKSAPLFATN